jgi:hypothetical protein
MLSIMLFVTAIVFLINTMLFCAYVSITGALGLIPTLVCLYIVRRLNPQDQTTEVEGWEIGEGVDIENPDKPKKVKAILEDRALDLGFLGLGSPGSGKSIMAIGLLKYFTEHRKKGWVYWEGKGDLDIYQKTVACGATPNKFFSSELPSSDSINVFSGDTDSVVERLTQILISDESDYYGNAQRSALRKVVPLIKGLNITASLRDLYVVYTREDAAMYVMNLAKEKEVSPDVIEAARMFFDIDEKDRMEQLKGLLNKMDAFVLGKIADRINAYNPTLDLKSSAGKSDSIYFHLPYSKLAKDLAIMLTEEIGEIAKERQLYDKNRQSWPQVYDDWGAFFYENFGPISARCRSAKMPISFLFQSKGQTDRVDGNRIFTTEITDNIGGMFILRINGTDTAKWAAEQFGEYETAELSRTDNTSYEGNNMSVNETPRVKSDTLKNLNAGEAIISCLISGEDGTIRNQRMKVRFPYPDFSEEKDIDWPVIKNHNNDEQEGLHLWRDFMNADRLNALKQQIIEEDQQIEKNHQKLMDVDYL